jgi:hypothetical protein
MESETKIFNKAKGKLEEYNWPKATKKTVDLLESGKFKCKVCKENITKDTQVFTYHCCNQIIHYDCLDYQTLSLKGKSKTYRITCYFCGNENIQFYQPRYNCWCGKYYELESPNIDLLPHGCGYICDYEICRHKRCSLPCHPGKHEEYKCKIVEQEPCGCGKKMLTYTCSQNFKVITCGDNCDKLLHCGNHKCEEVCHGGPCPRCEACRKNLIPETKTKTTVINLKKIGQKKTGSSCEKDTDIVYCGRANSMGGWKLAKSIWANPFKIQDYGTNEAACEKYEEYIRKDKGLMARLPELVGKKLACWCNPDPCHCHVLMNLMKEQGLI